MRRRFMFVIVGVVAGALLVAGVGTIVLLRVQYRQDTRRELVQLATNVADTATLINQPARLTNLRAFLQRTQDLTLFSVPLAAADRLPRGLLPGDIDRTTLAQGETGSGCRRAICFAVVPFRGPNGRLLAVGTTQSVTTGRGAVGYFLLAAAVALVLAAVAAEVLARRILLPLERAEAATREMASGNFAVRVPERGPAELTSLGASINVMAANLDRLRQSERAFLMSVSHDLRTPLTSIRGFAEALADGTTTDTAQAAEVIGAEARRLERLVRDLLELAKLNARAFSLEMRDVDLGEIAEGTAGAFEPEARRLGIDIVVHPPVTAGVVARADADRAAQMITNLVENALKYAGRRIEVATLLRTSHDGSPAAQVTVDDDGPGIAAADLPHVFDRLFTARGQGRAVGSGLGLAIVAELATAMGGAVAAESPAPTGPGTRVTLTLPAAMPAT